MTFAGVFAWFDNVKVEEIPVIENTKLGNKISTVKTKDFSEIGEDMDNQILKYPKNAENEEIAAIAEKELADNSKKIIEKQASKEGYEKAAKESEQALKDARKAGNKYTRSQARKQIDNLRKKINSTNTSLKHFKEVEPELLEKNKKAIINKNNSGEAKNIKNGFARGGKYTTSAFSQSHTYINSAKTVAGDTIRDTIRDDVAKKTEDIKNEIENIKNK